MAEATIEANTAELHIYRKQGRALYRARPRPPSEDQIRVYNYAPDRIALQIRAGNHFAHATITIEAAALVVGALTDAIAEARPQRVE